MIDTPTITTSSNYLIRILANAPAPPEESSDYSVAGWCCVLIVAFFIVFAIISSLYNRATTPTTDLSSVLRMVNKSKYDDRKLKLIASSFDPDEEAIAACDTYPEGRSEELYKKNPDKEFVTVVLTNKFLRTYYFKENGLAVSDIQKANRYSRKSLTVDRVSQLKIGFMVTTKTCTISTSGAMHHFTFVPDWRKEQDEFLLIIEKQSHADQMSQDSQKDSTDFTTELQRLHYLHTVGALSDSEWERWKAMIVGEESTASEMAAQQIMHLHKLFQNGSITESEFNMKKWDILSRK